MDSKEINELKSVIDSLKASDLDVEELEEEVKKRGLEKEIENFSNNYKDKIKEFIDSNQNIKEMSKEDKVKIIMELQNKMTSKQKKQFKSVMDILKKMKKGGK